MKPKASRDGHPRAVLLSLALMTLPSGTTGQSAGRGDASPIPPQRAVAYTFDDLPATRFTSLADARSITTRLLGHIRALGLPATGFVNERKLHEPPGEEDARAALLAAWLDAGLDLGNHTYSHLRLYDASLADFRADVLHGERVTRLLMAARAVVTLEQALADFAYTLPDEYVGPRGPSWLERWARTQGRDPGAPPPVPRWVVDAGR